MKRTVFFLSFIFSTGCHNTLCTYRRKNFEKTCKTQVVMIFLKSPLKWSNHIFYQKNRRKTSSRPRNNRGGNSYRLYNFLGMTLRGVHSQREINIIQTKDQIWSSGVYLFRVNIISTNKNCLFIVSSTGAHVKCLKVE